MYNYWWCAILFRIALPLIVAIAVFIRPTVTSYVYLIVGCYMPFFSVPTDESMAKSTGTYLKILILTCVLTSCFVLSFYFVLYFPSESEFNLKPCSALESALRTMGIIEFQGLDFHSALPWCLPEPLMLLTSVTFFFAFKKLCQETAVSRAAKEMEGTALAKEINRKKILSIMLNFGKYFVVFLFCLTGVLKATVFGAIYYLVFLLVITYWACNQSLDKFFARVLICLTPIIFLNMTIMFWYQFQYFYDSKYITSDSIWGRLFNLIEIKTYKDCKDPRIFEFHDQNKSVYAVPICLFFLYVLSMLVGREILQARDGLFNLILALCRSSKPKHTAWGKAFSKLQQKLQDDNAAGMDSLMADKVKNVVEQTLQFIIMNSYLAANFIMMVWAIVYVGWKTLILMTWANLVWLLPFRKKIILLTSPLVVAWVWFLLVTSYLYSMDLTPEELPPKYSIFNFKSGVDSYSKIKWFHLLAKSLFGVIIFVTMRQLWQARALRKQRIQLAAAVGASEKSLDETIARSPLLDQFQASCMRFFAIWWIWVVIFSMIWMDFWSTSNLFRIAFVVLAFLCIVTFQICPFQFWKRFLRFYWWFVIIYSMVNLFAIYLYQITVTRLVMHKYISEEAFQRYGFFVWRDRKKVTAALANPLFFQIAVVIQQNYLQQEFERATSPITQDELEEQQKKLAQSGPKWRKVKTFFIDAKNIFYQILEVHLQNITLLVGWYMCVFDMCALYIPIVLLLTASCIFGRTFTNVVIYFISCWVQILIVLRLVYMNQYSRHDQWNYVGHYRRNGEHFNKTLNTADWFGFHKSANGMEYADFSQVSLCFLYVCIVTLTRVVAIRMRNFRISRNIQLTRPRVLFPEITYLNCHDNTGNMLRFFANYGFYRFGCEICAVVATIIMLIRMDVVAIVLSFWLLLIFSLRRPCLRIIWLPTIIIVAAGTILQYWTTLGWWPSYWNNSLTRYWSSNDFRLRIQQFFHLLNMAHPPVKEMMSLDYFLLLLLSRQWRAFRREWNIKRRYSVAGRNDDVYDLLEDPENENPVPDFMTYTRSYLDAFKRICFISWFYLSLSCTFLAGTLRPTMLSFGYIIGAFIFAWEGHDFFLRPPRTIIRRWNYLIAYTILVMTTRTISQVFGCILVYEKIIDIYCPAYQLFTIGCVDKFHMTDGIPNLTKNPACIADFDTLGLAYDSICFFFLIFQQRIFKSYHFFHLVNDAKSQTILADRGAQLIEESRRKRKEALDAEDAQVRANIKKKMDKIRATHQKVQGEVYQRRKKNHKLMLKSSDYYLFDEAGLSNDIPLLPLRETQDDTELDPYDPQPLSEYFSLFHSNNIPAVLAERNLRKRQKRALQQGGNPDDVRNEGTISKPGTSKDQESPQEPVSKMQKIFDFITFLWGAVESSIVSITGQLNRTTKSFRSILNAMNKERKTLKEKTNFSEGIRLGSNKIWRPLELYKDVLNAAQQEKQPDQELVHFSIYVKLLRAIWLMLLSHSEWLCYLIIILNQVLRANFISLPLVILMCCWGALTVPKPTRTFWVITIAYVLIMLFLKNFFIMKVVPWNSKKGLYDSNLFFPPGIIGITSKTRVTFNFLMLATFFFHRVVLQMLGQWKPFTYRTSSLIQDGDYALRDGKLILLSRNEPRSSSTLEVRSISVPMSDYFPNSILGGLVKYAENFRLFTQQSITPSSTQIPVDVYTAMFLCDLVNLCLVMFFFGDFNSDVGRSGLVEFIQNNTVPVSFIVTVLVVVLLMVIDRAIYLRKNRFAKLVFHFFQVISYHLYFFILFPIVTKKKFRNTPVVQAFYVFKCLYFLFSAYQIRNGYPSLISFHHLWHGTTVFNRFGYKFYLMIPYFFEMRVLLDWICSDSCLAVSDWFKMEEITSNVFDQRCDQAEDENWSRQAGKAKSRTKKYLVGGSLYVLLILTVIFPFLLFSLSGTVGVSTHPAKIKLVVYIGSAEPIFESYASQKSLKHLSSYDYRNLTTTFNNIRESEDIFEKFKPEDVVVVGWSPNSLTKWKVSPGSYIELMEDVLSDDNFSYRVEIVYTHVGPGGQKLERTFGQGATIPPLPDPQRQTLINMLQSNSTVNYPIWLPLSFPKFLLIKRDGIPQPLPIMMEQGINVTQSYRESSVQHETDDDGDTPPDAKTLRNLIASLHISESGEKWWYITEECSPEDDNYFYYLKDLVHNTCQHLVMYTFNERIFSNTMNYVTQSGIIGLYLLYFMMVIGIIRSCRVSVGEIWIEDLPHSEDLMRKCLEVYIARDMQNFELEEELFAELIFIMRSRELLIKLSRFKDSSYNPPIVGSGAKRNGPDVDDYDDDGPEGEADKDDTNKKYSTSSTLVQ